MTTYHQDTSRYKSLTPVEHVRLRKSMYIGDCSGHTEMMYTFIKDDAKTVYTPTVLCNGLEKLFHEAIDNATDNTHRTPPTTDIRVQMTDCTFTCTNDGAHIPVQKSQDNVYTPSTIFLQMHSGSNFEDDKGIRIAAGMNGLGIKLAAILSHSFEVICHDPVVSLTFVQRATDGMLNIHEPIITERTGRCSKHITTSVKFTPNLTYFQGIKTLNILFPRVYTRLVQLSATFGGKVTFWFNGKKIRIRTFKEYVRSYSFDPLPVYYKHADTLEYALACSPHGEHTHVSFVNHLHTPDGGTHVRMLTTQVISTVITYFDKKLSKSALRPTRVQIRNNLTVFCSIMVTNPEFQSQSKRYLTSTISNVYVSPTDILSATRRCGLLDKITSLLSRKETTIMNDALTSKNKKKSIHVENLTDARFAGTSRSTQCSLFVVEGLSAKTFVVSGLAEIGNTIYGIYPVRGKPLNIFNSSQKAIVQNKEIGDLCKILGLRRGVDYSLQSSLDTLRYRHMIILTDADVDGFHICGLLIAFLFKLFPSLVKAGFIKRFVTPIIVAMDTKTNNRKEFFTIHDYNTWCKSTEKTHNKWNIKYFKGLGSSTKCQARSYFRSMKQYLKSMDYDECTADKLQLLFDSKNADRRKKWMINTQPSTLDYTAPRMNICRFVDTEMHDFSMETITRAIPGLDGLKESQRKVLYAVIQKTKTTTNEIKIAQLGAYAAEVTAYLHGEKSIQDTCNKMTHSFVGSNNLNLLEACGNTGSRLQLGNDAASTRYTFTKLMSYTRIVYHTLDDPILTQRTEEGLKIEYETFAPIIPIILINGSTGIATGFRTNIPCHDPFHLIKHIKQRLSGKITVFPPILPYYNGWKGTIIESEKEWLFHGVYTLISDTTKCIITELPVNVATERYKTKVLLPLVEKKYIKDLVEDHPDENSVCFRFDVTESFDTSMLDLVSRMSKGCINVLVDGKLQHFSNTNDLLTVFYTYRLKKYEQRRLYMIQHNQIQVVRLEAKRKFVQLILEGVIVFRNVSKLDMIERLVSHHIPRELCDPFLQMPMISLTMEKVNELTQQIQKIQGVLQCVVQATAESLWFDDLVTLETKLHDTSTSTVLTKKRKRVYI
jgi:DNA topoisomerase II